MKLMLWAIGAVWLAVEPLARIGTYIVMIWLGIWLAGCCLGAIWLVYFA